MLLRDIKEKIHEKLYDANSSLIKKLRPGQEKSIKAGLLEGKNILVCTPTASGKTFIAELAMYNSVFNKRGKAIYIVPLKALASEKYKSFKSKYDASIALSIGDLDRTDGYLSKYDVIIATAEKLDSLIRHHSPWLRDISVVVVDEVHLLNDPGRGPTLEILLTVLRDILPNVQVVALSATIGNPYELASWLDAELIEDTWRPVKLLKGIYSNEQIEFYNK